jgi:hypothetical protein
LFQEEVQELNVPVLGNQPTYNIYDDPEPGWSGMTNSAEGYLDVMSRFNV